MKCVACDAELTPAARFCAACAAPVPQAAADPADTLRVALENALGFQYRVERLLGRGGMGAVYLANELALEREVAIKVLPPEHGAGLDGKARFRREARTAARLSHPNIVPLITFGEVQGIAYYVMGYVPGESLAARMKREGRMPPETVARLLADVADALAYAHRQGVVHRDIKPDNILIDEESGRAVLTDFGIARAQGGGTLTGTGMIVGTPRYMSPEQAAGQADVDGRSDIYSLGLLGYEMLCGASPFDGRTPSDQLVQRLTKDPAPLRSRMPDVPRWLEEAITRSLARDPLQRWPDARVLHKQLLSGGTEDELPPSLTFVHMVAQFTCLAWMAGIANWLWGQATDQHRVMKMFDPKDGAFDPDPRLFALWCLTALLALTCLDARRKGYDGRAILRAISRQPAWWPGFYPRAARVPGDVWDRLPGHVRAARSATAVLIPLPALVLLFAAIEQTSLEHYERTGRYPVPQGITRFVDPAMLSERTRGKALAGMTILGFYLASALAYRSVRILRRGPLAARPEDDAIFSVFYRSTGNLRFWSRPAWAAILAPVTPPAPVTAPTLTATQQEDVTRSRVGS
jgi:predicted Ser/Thr protein kinase